MKLAGRLDQSSNVTARAPSLLRDHRLRLSFFTTDRGWRLQGWGLAVLTLLCFFPRLIHVEEYLFFLLLATTLPLAWKSGYSLQLARTPIDPPLVLFLGWVLVTVPFATDPAYSFAEWRKFAAPALAFYWAVVVLRANRHGGAVWPVLGALLLGTVVLCTYALVDFTAKGGTWRDRDIRASAPNSDYHWLTTYMVVAIPILVATTMMLRGWWSRLLCGLAIGLAVLTQFFSYTRAGWLGLAAQALAWGPSVRRPKWFVWALAGCSLIVVALLAASWMGLQRSTVDPWTLDARLAVWKLIGGKVWEHSFVGVGYGDQTFMMLFHSYPEAQKADGTHSFFLMVAMGSGLPALAFVVWLFVRATRVLLMAFPRLPDSQYRYLVAGVALMVIGFAVRNLFAHMFTGSLAYLFWMLMALGLYHVPNGLIGTERPREEDDESAL